MASFSEQFARARTALPGAAATAEIRAAAFKRFSTHGIPGRELENWRYTDLSPIQDTDYDLLAKCSIEDSIEGVSRHLARSRLLADAPCVVFVDGQYSTALSNPHDELDFSVSLLSDQWNTIASELEITGSLEEHPLALLNTAFTEQGLILHVPADRQVEQVLTIVFAGGERATMASQPRLLIRLEENSKLSVVVHFLDCTPADHWTNLVTQVEQGTGSKLELYEFQEHAGKQFHTELTRVVLKKDAQFKGGFIDAGGRIARRDIDIKLAEPGSSAEVFGFFLAQGGQHVDNHVTVDHIAAETSSNESFRGIVGTQSCGVFNGKVVVHPNAQRIVAHQRSDNLLLDASAEIDTKPELEIYADDVKCSHGATVGELDEQHLFYLQSRGIDADAARALLTFAFANSVLSEIQNDELRSAISERIASKLPEHERWEQPE